MTEMNILKHTWHAYNLVNLDHSKRQNRVLFGQNGKRRSKPNLQHSKKKETWELVDEPDDTNIIGSHWFFWLKHNVGGKITQHRAHLVAQGYTQAFGINYDNTFSPIIKLASLRIIAALAARNDWSLQQMDVDSAYLNMSLQEPVYMRQPPGYAMSQNKVCLLRKCLYGLKQSRREWYKCLSGAFYDFGFTRSAADTAVFYKHSNDKHVIIAAAVDDLTITANSDEAIEELKQQLKCKFKMKDLGNLTWLLNIEVKQDRKLCAISFSQTAYIDAILARFTLQKAAPVTTPMDPHVTFSKTQCPSTPQQCDDMKKVPYREIIGSLMWAAIAA